MFRRELNQSNHSATALIENLEGRRLLAASALQVVGVKIAKTQDSDGTALNQNRITVAFGTTNSKGKVTYGAISLADASLIRSFGYADDLLNPGLQRKVTVGLSITHSSASPHQLTIITDRLVRKGSRLFINLGAVKDASNNDVVFDGSTPAKTVTLTVGQNKPRFTMANRNWRPTDLSYFSKTIFTAAPTPATASTAPSSSSIRASLLTFMNAKVSKAIITQAKADAAMALYDSTTITTEMSSNTRAALASLYGTVAEPAIDSFVGTANVTNKKFTGIVFDSNIAASATVAETKISTTSGRLRTILRPTFAGEAFQALSSILAREIVRQDTTGDSTGNLPDSQNESIIANAIETIVYAQQALVDSTFVGNGTALVNRANDRLLALLNSGDALFPYGGIFQAPALNSSGNIFVGAKTDPGNFNDTTTVKSFENWIRREYIFRGFGTSNTVSNPTTVTILKNIVGSTGDFTSFGTTVMGYLDTRNAILTDATYIKLAQALKLTF